MPYSLPSGLTLTKTLEKALRDADRPQPGEQPVILRDGGHLLPCHCLAAAKRRLHVLDAAMRKQSPKPSAYVSYSWIYKKKPRAMRRKRTG